MMLSLLMIAPPPMPGVVIWSVVVVVLVVVGLLLPVQAERAGMQTSNPSEITINREIVLFMFTLHHF
jgi:hypothetical protein